MGPRRNWEPDCRAAAAEAPAAAPPPMPMPAPATAAGMPPAADVRGYRLARTINLLSELKEGVVLESCRQSVLAEDLAAILSEVQPWVASNDAGGRVEATPAGRAAVRSAGPDNENKNDRDLAHEMTLVCRALSEARRAFERAVDRLVDYGLDRDEAESTVADLLHPRYLAGLLKGNHAPNR